MNGSSFIRTRFFINGWWFEDIEIPNTLYFYEYFRTSAEFREERINQIFE